MTLDEVVAQIDQGRAFPPQRISVSGATPVVAFQLLELRDAWARVTPSSEPFSGATGRAKPLLLGRLFAELAMHRATGYLYLRQGDANLYFAFRFVDGQLWEVCAHDPSTYLGQLFVQQRALTPNALSEVLAIAQNREEPIGKVCIDEGLIDIKTLNRALAEQIFTRLRRISCFPKSDILFRPDRRAKMSPPVARISGYSVLEICLGYGLGDEEIKNQVTELLSCPIEIDYTSSGLSLLSVEDRSVLKQIESHQGDLRIAAQRPNWTQRDAALKVITWDLMHAFKVPVTFQLAQEYQALIGEDPYHHLGLNHYASPHDIKNAVQNYSRSLGLSEPSDTEQESQFKEAILKKLATLSESISLSEREQSVLARMQQMGVDTKDEVMKQNLLFDLIIQEGQSALKRQRYKAAEECFREAASIKPKDIHAALQAIWSKFLASDRDKEIYLEVKSRAEHLSHLNPDEPAPFFTLAQIQRLYGDNKLSEKNLRKVLKIQPNHPQAQAELRLLLNREFDQKKRRVTRALKPEGGSTLWQVAIGLSLLITLAFWGMGRFMPHTRDLWPEVKTLDTSSLIGMKPFERQLEFNRVIRTNYDPDLIASAAYRLGLKAHPKAEGNIVEGYTIKPLDDQQLRELRRDLGYLYVIYEKRPTEVLDSLQGSRVIPVEMRVIGNVEHYWLNDDFFWWARRFILLLAAALGLARLKPFEITWVGTPSVAFLGIIYGAIVGFMSPAFNSPTPMDSLLMMKGIHVLTEQAFFTFFLGLALLKGFEWRPVFPVMISILAFSLYKGSFLYISYLEPRMISIQLLQVGVFIGGGSMLLLWKSRGVLAPILAHVTLTLIPLLKGMG